MSIKNLGESDTGSVEDWSNYDAWMPNTTVDTSTGSSGDTGGWNFSVDLGVESWSNVLKNLASIYSTYKNTTNNTTTSSNGVTSTTLADGTKIYRYANGSTVIVKPDGTRSTTDANGNTTVTTASGATAVGSFSSMLSSNMPLVLGGAFVLVAILLLRGKK